MTFHKGRDQQIHERNGGTLPSKVELELPICRRKSLSWIHRFEKLKQQFKLFKFVLGILGLRNTGVKFTEHKEGHLQFYLLNRFQPGRGRSLTACVPLA